MTSLSPDLLPATERLRCQQWSELVEQVADAYRRQMPLYPVGGGTSLDYGVVPRREGRAVELGELKGVLDYPARDMTITVEAGMTMAELQRTLAEQSQELPIDVPQASQATLGGVLATNFNGPRRFGHGTLRDYVLGIEAVDGRGCVFRGGGRVVKNVAGYDFCKLLIGSLGTLGILGQVTLKVKPRPETHCLLVCAPDDLAHLERLLDGLLQSAVRPVAVEALVGEAWGRCPSWSELDEPVSPEAGWLVVRLEGTAPEVEWMVARLESEWLGLGIRQVSRWHGAAGEEAWRQICEFPAAGAVPLSVKITCVPNATVEILRALHQVGAPHSIQAHAANGVLIVRWEKLPAEGVMGLVVQRLRPLAAAASGQVTILSSTETGELTRQAVWGSAGAAYSLMARVKQQFDPSHILNPQRFLFP